MSVWIERRDSRFLIERLGPFEKDSEAFKKARDHQVAIAQSHNGLQPRVGPNRFWQLVYVKNENEHQTPSTS